MNISARLLSLVIRTLYLTRDDISGRIRLWTFRRVIASPHDDKRSISDISNRYSALPRMLSIDNASDNISQSHRKNIFYTHNSCLAWVVIAEDRLSVSSARLTRPSCLEHEIPKPDPPPRRA